jgi:PhzF family phenazine biosynthesis protein
MPSFYWIDAFANQAFSGNPAGVCLLDSPADEAWMGRVAHELGISETAFVYPVGNAWSLRWFTPKVEVSLCGHATMAAAHALWESGKLGKDQEAVFKTLSGELRARYLSDAIELDFPARASVTADPPPGLLKALGLEAALEILRTNNEDWLIVIEGGVKAVAALRPDFSELKKTGGRGICVTSSCSKPEADFCSRFFAPAVGINEDPVTGAAHCALGPYWGARLGKKSLSGLQLSARGGNVGVELRGERVGLQGRAVTLIQGQIQN